MRNLGEGGALLLAAMASCAGASPPPPRAMSYADLVSLFADWRELQKPRLVDGVPDYTPAAMAAQHRALAGYQQKLAAIVPGDWPVAQQADYHVVRAEMNALDFDHRVLRRASRGGKSGAPVRAGGERAALPRRPQPQ